MLKEYFKQWIPPVEEELRVPQTKDFGVINEKTMRYIQEFVLSPGKRVRPILLIAGYNNYVDKVPPYVIKVAAALELFHAFLLIHDDFMDRDEIRRGLPTVWKRFEEDVKDRHLAYSLAVVAGDILYSLVFRKIIESNAPNKEFIIDKLTDVMIRTGYGQNIDLYLSKQPLDQVKEEDILLMYELKTGIYTLGFPLQLGANMAGMDGDNLYRFGIGAGVAFQIQDDIIGVFGDPEVTGKPSGSDIREGKRSYLIVRAYKNATKEEKEILKEALGSSDEQLIEQARAIIEKRGLPDANRLKKKLVSEAIREIEGERLETFFKELAEYLVNREK